MFSILSPSTALISETRAGGGGGRGGGRGRKRGGGGGGHGCGRDTHTLFRSGTARRQHDPGGLNGSSTKLLLPEGQLPPTQITAFSSPR